MDRSSLFQLIQEQVSRQRRGCHDDRLLPSCMCTHMSVRVCLWEWRDAADEGMKRGERCASVTVITNAASVLVRKACRDLTH